MFIAVLFTVANIGKQVSIYRNKMCYYTTEYYAALQKKEVLSFAIPWTYWMFGRHYVKWNKPDTKRQILYDLTYMWNLKQKT